MKEKHTGAQPKHRSSTTSTGHPPLLHLPHLLGPADLPHTCPSYSTHSTYLTYPTYSSYSEIPTDTPSESLTRLTLGSGWKRSVSLSPASRSSGHMASTSLGRAVVVQCWNFWFRPGRLKTPARSDANA